MHKKAPDMWCESITHPVRKAENVSFFCYDNKSNNRSGLAELSLYFSVTGKDAFCLNLLTRFQISLFLQMQAQAGRGGDACRLDPAKVGVGACADNEN